MTTAPPRMMFVGSLLATAILALTLPSPAAAQLTCGGTIGPGGSFTMTADILNCGAGTTLTVVGPVTLDLDGHRIGCAGGLSAGIRIQGTNAQVTTGQVFSCFVGVEVTGSGGHKVSNVYTESNILGFGVTSDGNTLTGNVASSISTDRHGFQVTGNRNKLVDNSAVGRTGTGFATSGNANAFDRNSASGAATAFGVSALATGNKLRSNVASASDLGPTAVGFDVAGAKHLLMNNRVLDPLQYGFHVHDGSGEHVLQGNVVASNGFVSNSTAFQIAADGNRLKNNRAQGHQIGIHVTSHGNTLTGNAGSGNNADAIDDDPNCDDNVWKNNQFGLTAGLRPIAASSSRGEGASEGRGARRFGCHRRQVYGRRVAKRITMAKRPLKLRLPAYQYPRNSWRVAIQRRCGSASKACSRWSVDIGHGAARQA